MTLHRPIWMVPVIIGVLTAMPGRSLRANDIGYIRTAAPVYPGSYQTDLPAFETPPDPPAPELPYWRLNVPAAPNYRHRPDSHWPTHKNWVATFPTGCGAMGYFLCVISESEHNNLSELNFQYTFRGSVEPCVTVGIGGAGAPVPLPPWRVFGQTDSTYIVLESHTNACVDSQVTLRAQNQNGNPVASNWSINEENGITPDPTSTDWQNTATITFSAANPREYNVTGVSVADPNLSDSATVTIIKVELKEGTTVINEDDYVYITGTPQMPQLKASLKPTGLSGNAKWRLYVEYTRPDRGSYTGDKEYYPGPDASTWKTISAGGTWDIAAEFGTQFRGGKATLYCEYQGVQCQQIFHIRGNNPTEAAAKAYLDASGPWFAYCIAKHESGTQSGRTYLQFNEAGTLGPNPADYKYCPNRGAGGAPYGWGMMQLDNIELPGQTTYRSPDNGDPWAQELWSWKANCDTAIQVLTRKGEISTAHLKTIAPDGAGGYIMPPDITVSGVSFTGGGAHTPDQLDVIKLYNGGYFWTAYDPVLGWTHVTIGGPTKDYTEKVLDEY